MPGPQPPHGQQITPHLKARGFFLKLIKHRLTGTRGRCDFLPLSLCSLICVPWGNLKSLMNAPFLPRPCAPPAGRWRQRGAPPQDTRGAAHARSGRTRFPGGAAASLPLEKPPVPLPWERSRTRCPLSWQSSQPRFPRPLHQPPLRATVRGLGRPPSRRLYSRSLSILSLQGFVPASLRRQDAADYD